MSTGPGTSAAHRVARQVPAAAAAVDTRRGRPAEDNPFPGPKPYQADQATVFFGRDEQSDELTSLVLSTGIVLLHAPSGFGKSSLLAAGLLPALREERVTVLPPVRLGQASTTGPGPGEDHSDAAGNGNPYVQVVCDTIRPGERHASLSRVLRGAGTRVLVIDQFEEIFLEPTLWQERGAFLSELRRAVEDDSGLRIVIAMRSDYLADLVPHESALPSRLVVKYGLRSLDEAAARRVIDEAFVRTGVPLSPQDLSRVLDNLLVLEPAHPGAKPVRGQYVNLIQLQILCRRLWSERASDATSASAATETMDLADSMRLFIDAAVADVVREARLDEGVLRRWLEDHLLTPGGRRAVLPLDADAAGLPLPAVLALERARLLQIEQRNRTRWVELTHDSMVAAIQESNRHWGARHARGHRWRTAAAASLLLVVLASLFWLRVPGDGVVHAQGSAFPGDEALLSIEAAPGDEVLILRGTLEGQGWDDGRDTAATIVAHTDEGTESVVGEISGDLDTETPVFTAVPAEEGVRYDVVPGDMRTEYALSLETLPAVLDPDDLASGPQSVPYEGVHAAAQFAPGSTVALALPDGLYGLSDGARRLYQSVEEAVVQVPRSGFVVAEGYGSGGTLEALLLDKGRAVEAGRSLQVSLDRGKHFELRGLHGNLPAVLTTRCDTPVSVGVSDRSGTMATEEQRQGPREWTTTTTLVGPAVEDARLVLLPEGGTQADCSIRVDPVAPVAIDMAGEFAMVVEGALSAVPLVTTEDRILLLPVPEGLHVQLVCSDVTDVEAEGGTRLLGYLPAGRRCSLAAEPLLHDAEPTTLTGTLLPTAALPSTPVPVR